MTQDSQTAVFRTQAGELQERPYNHFYSLLPAAADPIIGQAGLADSQGLLDVDRHTLQHKQYRNIFGLGDVTNVPTTKTFLAGFNQLSVIRHNLERRINGLEPDVHYDGETEAVLNVGFNGSTKFKHAYDGQPKASLVTGFSAELSAMLANQGKKSTFNLLKFKNWGAPYYKLKKTFKSSGNTEGAGIDSKLFPKEKTA